MVTPAPFRPTPARHPLKSSLPRSSLSLYIPVLPPFSILLLHRLRSFRGIANHVIEGSRPSLDSFLLSAGSFVAGCCACEAVRLVWVLETPFRALKVAEEPDGLRGQSAESERPLRCSAFKIRAVELKGSITSAINFVSVDAMPDFEIWWTSCAWTVLSPRETRSDRAIWVASCVTLSIAQCTSMVGSCPRGVRMRGTGRHWLPLHLQN
jgi:hypothetical protein